MSFLSTNQPVASQFESHHLSKFPDTDAQLSTRNMCQVLQDEQLCTSPFQKKAFRHTTPSPIGLDTNVFRINHKPLKQLSDDVITQRNVGTHNSVSTCHTDSLTLYHQGTRTNAPVFNQPFIVSLACEDYSKVGQSEVGLAQEKVFPEVQAKHTIDFTTNDRLVVGGNERNNHEELRTPRIGVIHEAGLIPITFKQTASSIDKKEMRARRNRESARRSRLKSKQHFHALETKFVFMIKENNALRLLVEKLLSRHIDKSPHVRGRLQSLLTERL